MLAHLQYKSSICTAYSTQAACLAQPADACGWDRLGGGCFLSASAAYDPELLQGRLYCRGSLLDTAAACALLVPPQGRSVSAAAAAIRDSCAAVNPACVSLGAEQLVTLGPSAAAYAQLAALVTYSASDTTVGAGGCAARWLTQPDTLAALGRSVAAAPAAGLLQPDLVGSCPEVAQLAAAFAAAAANCSAPPRAAAAEACTGGGLSCRWEADSSDGGDGGAGGTCVVGDDVLYNVLYDANDPWVRALSAAADACDGHTSRAACEAAGGTIRVDQARMAAFRDVLQQGGGAGLGPYGGGRRGRRMVWMALGAGGLAVAAAALWAGCVA